MFIKLKHARSSHSFILNTAHIKTVLGASNSKNICFIYLIDGSEYEVMGTYEELYKLLNNSEVKENE